MERNTLIILTLSSILLFGCMGSEDDSALVTDEDTVLVEVEGEPITLTMLEHQLGLRGIEADDIEGMRNTLEDMIRVVAVARRGDREGISMRQKVRAERKLKDIEIRYLRYLDAYSEEHPVDEQEIQAVYELQRERAGDYRYRLETIEFAEQSAALDMLERLRADALDFEQAISEASAMDRTARRTDWIDGSQVPPAFSDLLANTEPGRVLDRLLPYQDLWLVVRLAEREAFSPPPLEEVRDGIRRTLRRERTQEMIETTRAAAEVTPILPLDPGGPETDVTEADPADDEDAHGAEIQADAPSARSTQS